MTEQVVSIEDEMRGAYLDYAMSVIVSRALPDVRDGLKPVQRRVMYTMWEMGLRANQPFRKSAGVVGEVMGKYHPHGDSAIYDAMVRMAQPFSLRYPLVTGQGNFGSVDNDPPAAMRYTEARLSAIAAELLQDIDRDTVPFAPNYDDRVNEPVVLPSRLPNLLINGVSGIAVGMATSIPPHNLSEISDAMVHLIDNPDASVLNLLDYVKGPDFPTAGIIMGRSTLEEAYSTGRGRVVVQARAEIEKIERGNRSQIVVSEIPYQVNKATLVERIANLVREKKIDGISEVRDESDRRGMRIVIELRRDAWPEQVLNSLYKNTAMRTSFHFNTVALFDGQPRVTNLKGMLTAFIGFRKEVVTRRAEYDLSRARDRAHILEGLKIALDNLDAVISFIRSAESAEQARSGLMEQWDMSQRQAQAILDLQLRRLAALERQAILDEYAEILENIAELEDLLGDVKKVEAVVRAEIIEIKDNYGDERRTEISEEEARDFSKEELVPHQEVAVTLSTRGYIKRVPATTYRIQHRGGRGITGMVTREADAVQHLLICDTHETLLLFTNRGRLAPLKVYDLPPESSRTARGTPLVNFVPIDPRIDQVTTIISTKSMTTEGASLVMATRMGEVKRALLNKFKNLRINGIIAMDLEKDDELVSGRIATDEDHVLILTALGRSIRFRVGDLRSASRTSGGVRGIKLRKDDYVKSMEVVSQGQDLLSVTANGHGKLTALTNYPQQKRGGQGVINFKMTDKTGPVSVARVTSPDQEIMVVSTKGVVIRQLIQEIPRYGRSSQGVRVMNLDKADTVASLARIEPSSEDEAEEEVDEQEEEPKTAKPKAEGKKPKKKQAEESEE